MAQDGDGIEAALVARPCRQFADLALQTVNRGESSQGALEVLQVPVRNTGRRPLGLRLHHRRDAAVPPLPE